ncbi:MAG TPA: polysaccharide biosynthesis/export family protein [Caulobacteraceae bacterium]|nr:polysaccharide biosynthesis/export family protein [Caulobacteraceae bacterium]
MSWRNSICALALAALTGCASGGGIEHATSLPPPDPAALATIGSGAEYRIGPLDQLDISVFQAPELARSVQVDAAGQITMPLIGSIPAAGKTLRELQASIASALSAKYLQSPEVTVVVKEYASQRVTLDGAVTAPGVYPIRGRTTLLQAVAMSKGPTRLANDSEVVVFRTVNGQRMAARFDLSAIRKGEADDPEIYGNDIVVVGSSGARSVLREVLGLLPVFSVFRPLIF